MAKSVNPVKFPHGTMATPYAKGMIVLAGSSCPDLAASVTRQVKGTSNNCFWVLSLLEHFR